MLTIEAERTFLQLISDTWTLWDIEPPEFDFDDDESLCFEIEVEDTEFTLVHLPFAEPDHFTIFCRLGGLPADGAGVMQKALEINLLTGSAGGAVLGMNPFTSEMMLAMRVALADTDAQALVVSVAAMAQQARRWRQTHFLDEDPQALPGALPRFGGLA